MSKLLKRLFDLITALILLVLTLPFSLVAYIGIRLGDRGPALFKHQRAGKNEKPFTLYKFRTMKNLYDEDGRLLPDEQRLTGFGQWLRRLSLDELPQFINVLKGDMSLVGPRPLLMQYLPLYNDRQKKRHLVSPGITGWAQVNGRNAISWEEKFELDVWYVENWSLKLDFKIMLMTAGKIFKREGISADGHATMPFFTGSPEEKKQNGKD